MIGTSVPTAAGRSGAPAAPTTYFTSDTHFGDPRVLRIDKRPFANIQTHDAALIERWNEVVGPEDEVWHLGDFALHVTPERVEDLLRLLHGRKHLVTGNNDGPATLSASGWASLQPYAELNIDGQGLVLCHYAFRTWKNMGRGWIDLHGHSHGRLKTQTRQFDVGVDLWGYRPVGLATILGAKRRAPREAAGTGSNRAAGPTRARKV